jgi:A/G-specific adenine glycosylase
MNRKERVFIKTVWDFYKEEGRHTLPWRNLPAGRQGQRNPYRILVSEVMLQQTQVERVIPKYQEFLRVFGTVEKLAEAPLGDVLRMWQGLGYNRRAKMLHEAGKRVTGECGGTFPKTYEGLRTLPGVGSYTAGAVMVFAYNTPVPIIETNIRTVFIHHFFNDATDIPDSEIVRYIERTLDLENPREWYYALMDYGAYLKKKEGNLNTRSKHYTKQSTFKGSDRQIRGAIVRALTEHRLTREELHEKLSSFDIQRIDAQVERLKEEGMIIKRANRHQLP